MQTWWSGYVKSIGVDRLSVVSPKFLADSSWAIKGGKEGKQATQDISLRLSGQEFCFLRSKKSESKLVTEPSWKGHWIIEWLNLNDVTRMPLLADEIPSLHAQHLHWLLKAPTSEHFGSGPKDWIIERSDKISSQTAKSNTLSGERAGTCYCTARGHLRPYLSLTCDPPNGVTCYPTSSCCVRHTKQTRRHLPPYPPQQGKIQWSLLRPYPHTHRQGHKGLLFSPQQMPLSTLPTHLGTSRAHFSFSM